MSNNVFYFFVQKLTFLPQISHETSCILKIYLASIFLALLALLKYIVCRNLTKMLWNTLIWLWNGANLSIYKHVTYFVPNLLHKANYPCANFIPLWELMWCHCVLYVRHIWNVCTVGSLQENTHATTTSCGWNAGAHVETWYDVTSIPKVR